MTPVERCSSKIVARYVENLFVKSFCSTRCVA